ncbi:hypothetical protein Bhyg_07067 [Pseudolycoriella hygida]|uniref:Uncharacterized protein n=1 Tax=Pseudolycoriella hygida TaxID=35572 RepID=A0A9Q0N2E8_9DIPT|nr:hypothetical protein Bhyg_07067 [Pseudolycoriella hygida]
MIYMVFLMLVCQVQYICAYERYPYEYFYPENEFIEEERPVESDGNSLADYWKVFKETFQKSYSDLNKPYVIEREVPVYIPVDRVRTVVKHHPVFIKPDRIIIRRWRPNHNRY